MNNFQLRSDNSADNSAPDVEVDIRYIQVDVDGKQYDLKLKSRYRGVIYSTTPVWTVRSGQEGFSFTNVTDVNIKANLKILRLTKIR